MRVSKNSILEFNTTSLSFETNVAVMFSSCESNVYKKSSIDVFNAYEKKNLFPMAASYRKLSLKKILQSSFHRKLKNL
jgi:hypothetical protein